MPNLAAFIAEQFFATVRLWIGLAERGRELQAVGYARYPIPPGGWTIEAGTATARADFALAETATFDRLLVCDATTVLDVVPLVGATQLAASPAFPARWTQEIMITVGGPGG